MAAYEFLCKNIFTSTGYKNQKNMKSMQIDQLIIYYYSNVSWFLFTKEGVDVGF